MPNQELSDFTRVIGQNEIGRLGLGGWLGCGLCGRRPGREKARCFFVTQNARMRLEIVANVKCVQE